MLVEIGFYHISNKDYVRGSNRTNSKVFLKMFEDQTLEDVLNIADDQISQLLDLIYIEGVSGCDTLQEYDITYIIFNPNNNKIQYTNINPYMTKFKNLSYEDIMLKYSK